MDLYDIDHDDVGYDFCIHALRNSDGEEKQYAALALGRLGNKEAIPHLKKVFSDVDEELDVRFACAEALARLGIKEVYDFVIDNFLENKLKAVRILGFIGGEQAKEKLNKYAASTDYELRIASRKALERIIKTENPDSQEDKESESSL